MSGYSFYNTERTKEKGADYETYATLYLIGKHKDKDKFEYIIVDCFNDITAANKGIKKLWDVQCKGYSSISPSVIGSCLFTLYKNFCHTFPFTEFILFLEMVPVEYLIEQKQIFKFSNFNSVHQNMIKAGLLNTIEKNNKIAFKDIQHIKLQDDQLTLTNFLGSVNFVVGYNNKVESIKKLIKFKNFNQKNDDFYISIFDDIRSRENNLKLHNIEGRSIETAPDVLKLNKCMTYEEITSLLISRIVGIDLFNYKSIPNLFFDELVGKERFQREEIITDCNSRLSKMFFDKNNKKNIWIFLERIIQIVDSNKTSNLNQLYNCVSKNIIDKISELNSITVKYLISIIQEGLSNDKN